MRYFFFEQIIEGLVQIGPVREPAIGFVLVGVVLTYITYRALTAYHPVERWGLGAAATMAGAAVMVIASLKIFDLSGFGLPSATRNGGEILAAGGILGSFVALGLLKLVEWLRWIRQPPFESGGSTVTPDMLRTGNPLGTSAHVLPETLAKNVLGQKAHK